MGSVSLSVKNKKKKKKKMKGDDRKWQQSMMKRSGVSKQGGDDLQEYLREVEREEKESVPLSCRFHFSIL